MSKEIYEIIEELKYSVDGSPFLIEGRIIIKKGKKSPEMYFGRLSHYCKPSVFASAAYKQTFQSSDIEKVKRDMENYMKNFHIELAEENDQYDRLTF